MNLNQSKELIISIKQLISYNEYCAVTPKIKKKIFKIINEVRPELVTSFLKINRLSIKYHLIYCFLNDLKIHPRMRFFKFDKNLNRITEESLSLREFAYRHRPQGKKTNRVSLQKIYDAGMDLKYPKLNEYKIEKINKILNRIVSKHKRCEVCNKFFKVKHKTQKLCGIHCQSKLTSERMKVSNPSILYYDKIFTKAYRKRHSKRMKDKIANGEFTPNVTNSWANSKVNLKMFNINFRSSWEAYFYAKMFKNNHNIFYEKIRIKYYDSILKKYRNYITDFTDEENKVIYEIKPFSNKSNKNNVEKEKYANIWCIENNYQFIFICEDWFKENYDENLLKELNNDKIFKGMKQFKC